jgi:hypothetical protein
MEFPMEDWVFSDVDEFDVAPPTITGELVLELFAQLRPTGRILDNFRLAMDGSKLLTVAADLGAIIPANRFAGHKLRFQQRPRDIAFRRNMFSTGWIDVVEMVLANEASVYDHAGEVVPNDVFARAVADLPDAGPETASLRWAVTVGPDRRMVLQLQSLPAHATLLNGRVIYNRYVP